MPVHLISGGAGAGKSTYAALLAATESAVLFTLDEWMEDLFLVDDHSQTPAWTLERVTRCERRILAQTIQAAKVGISSVLDLGLMFEDQRTLIHDLCIENGIEPTWHTLEVSAEQRWARVSARNAAGAGRQVSRARFEAMEARTTPLHGPDRWRAIQVGLGRVIRPARQEDGPAIDAVLQAAYGSPDEAALFRALGDDALLTLVLERAPDRPSLRTRPIDDLIREVTEEVSPDDISGVVGVAVVLRMGGDTEGILGIGPLAVHPQHHGTGLGAALLVEVLTRIEGHGAPAAVLLGDPEVYGRFGFEAADAHGLRCGLPGPRFQVRRFADVAPARLSYPAPFGRP